MPYKKRGRYYWRKGKKYTRKQIEAIHFAKLRKKGKKNGG